MQNEWSADKLYAELRVLVVADPKRARLVFNELLDHNDPRLPDLFAAMRAPAEGRVRQLVANTVRARKDNISVIPHLLQWQAFESDEFAKRAIDAALEGTDPSNFTRVPRPESRTNGYSNDLASKEAVEIYRWIATRLCHRVRNSLNPLPAALVQIDRVASKVSDNTHRGQLAAEVAVLKDTLRRISRVVEFNVGDSHLQWREISLWFWLKEMATQYGSQHDPIEFSITGPAAAADVKINGSDLLLETVFWNLWKNAAQAVNGPCRVEAVATLEGRNVDITLLDNGSGLSPSQAQEAFRSPISTKGPEYGHGLLEVAEAVGRLQGTARLIRTGDGSYRVLLVFPRL